MDVLDILGRIEQINRADTAAAAEFGPLELGPRGVEIGEVLAVDGRTRHPASPQLRAFYGYALWWRHCSVELHWLDPLVIEETMSLTPIRTMIDADLGGTLDVAGMSASTTALLAIDDAQAPFDRAYLVFGPGEEPRVVHAGSEVSVHDCLADYLSGWLVSLS